MTKEKFKELVMNAKVDEFVDFPTGFMYENFLIDYSNTEEKFSWSIKNDSI